MSGLSYDIDKLLRVIQGVGRNQSERRELQPASSVSNATATSLGNGHSTPYFSNSRHPVSSNFEDQHSLYNHNADIENYEAPLDAFGKHLVSRGRF